MVNIDTVYQRVLALANKEQRGYITPQDFNLFANQAQMEIFEQYFYDVNLARKTQGNDTVYADVDDMLEEKMQIFERIDNPADIALYQTDAISNMPILPNFVYRVNMVYTGEIDGGDPLVLDIPVDPGTVEPLRVKCEILNTKDFLDCTLGSYLTRPTPSRPVANISNSVVICNNGTVIGPTMIVYFRTPIQVNWGYIVMNQQAMYNNLSSQNFDLHESEETQLVNKILRLAGISIKQTDIMQAGQGMDAVTIQQQPKT